MQRKTPLPPRKYEDKKAKTKLSWDIVKKDSIPVYSPFTWTYYSVSLILDDHDRV
jgi:hypothetical protein